MNRKTSMVAKFLQLLSRFSMAASSRARNAYYRAAGVRMTGYVWLRHVEIPYDRGSIELNECSLDIGVVLLCDKTPRADGKPKILINRGAYLNRHTFVDAVQSVTIGEHVAIGPGCYITDHDHGADPLVPPLEREMVAKPTSIGARAWIGAHVTILKGVTIGEGAIVGAGSVVTKDVPPLAVAAGVPAKVIRIRPPSGNAGLKA